MQKIKVEKANKIEFKKLLKLDFSNNYNKIFSIKYDNQQIKISEIELKKSVLNNNENYILEIQDYIKEIDKDNTVAFICYFNNKPVGYIFASKEQWSNRVNYNIKGILVAKKYQKKGLAQALINKLIDEAKNDNVNSIYVEMDTYKYSANKLLLKMGFNFAGTKFYIYSTEKPSKYSKEAIYFHYKV